MSLTGHHMPPRTTQQSHRPRVSDRTMVGTLPPRCLQALPHGTKNAATDGPGYRATPRSTTEPHRGWMSDTYLLHLHAEGEKCFLLTSPFIEPRNATLHNRAAQGLDVRHLPSPSPCGRGEVFSLDIPFYRTPPALHPSQSRETRTRGGTARLAVEQLSSLSFRGGRGGRNRVAVDCAKEGTDGSHAADCGSKSNSPPCHCK